MLDIFDGTVVIPILTIDRVADAVPLASALVRGGLRVMEIALRTPDAFAAIEAIVRNVPDAVPGAGTLLTGADIGRAIAAGARFLASPGLTPDLAAAGLSSDLPYLPGAVTPSEVIEARDAGFSLLKYFPAAASGGTLALSSYAAVFAGIAFYPTGGITAENAGEFLALGNVKFVGGSWMVPADAITAQNWDGVERLARKAAELRTRRK